MARRVVDRVSRHADARREVGDFLLPKPHTYRDDDYLAWLRTLPCIVPKCKKPSEASHTGDHGYGIKAMDYQAVPMCHDHHIASNSSWHGLGRERFEEMYGLDVDKIVIGLLARYIQEKLLVNMKGAGV